MGNHCISSTEFIITILLAFGVGALWAKILNTGNVRLEIVRILAIDLWIGVILLIAYR